MGFWRITFYDNDWIVITRLFSTRRRAVFMAAKDDVRMKAEHGRRELLK